jgi:FAD/FMN-containing dehydrogenase/Fe-S oxidoreductase
VRTTDVTVELAAAIRGDVQTDALSRALYATDASIYQVEPIGVVLPRDAADIAATLQIARKHRVPVLPRGGGTSLAGQAVGQAIHLDFTKYMSRLLEVNAAERWAWVEPGIVLDELNAKLAPHGLMFAPDVSPSNRATVGGMIGNNSSGMYSVVYGKTIDHVLELNVMLADGSVAHVRSLGDNELREKLTLDSLEGRAHRTVARLAREHAEEIERRFPKVLRRVGGYNLDAFVSPVERSALSISHSIDGADLQNAQTLNAQQPDAPTLNAQRPNAQQPNQPTNAPTRNAPTRNAQRKGFNLANIIVGSEGTLAVILAAKVRLVPRPKHTAIGILAFETLDAALDAVVPCLETTPAAVELMDDILLDLTRTSHEYAKYLASFVQGEPAALLQVEFFGESADTVRDDLVRLEQHLREIYKLEFGFTPAITPHEKQAVLKVRKAGLPLLQSLSPDVKPETFVEDSAVAPQKLGAYIREFRNICHAEGVRVAFYGHASVGLMHARPLLNLKSAGDVAKMRRIAEAVKDLVIAYGGALSGEHGDGMLRAEFNRELFGPTLYEAFREVKRTFDPHGLLNPGKIVDAPPMDSHLRYGTGYHVMIPLQTHFAFRDTGGMAGAAELCNGNGLCRKTTGGTMCPSYMATRDEEHSTRGRANALRMVLSGALPASELTGARMHEVMELCIECKGCTAECPSRVNMTRLKSEWLAHTYATNGVPLRTRLFGNIRRINELGSALAPLANLALRLPGLGILNEKLLGISRHRRLPTFAKESFHQWFARLSVERLSVERSHVERTSIQPAHTQRSTLNDQRPTVVLFPDTFADYNEPQIARAAVKVLEAAGYHVILPTKRVCCGRPQISKGLLPEVKALAKQQLDALGPYAAAGIPIVGLEPSCLLSFRDEYPDLLDDPRAEVLAAHAFLFDEFLAREIADGRAKNPFSSVLGDGGTARATPYLLHGHCHQKALVGSGHALALLHMIPGAVVREVDSGCCGMAGSFGYEAEHFEISRKIGERALLPAVRALPPEAEVVAMGTSCRHQIVDLAGRKARHLAEVLADAL